MTENVSLTNTLLKEINQLQADILKTESEKNKLEWTNSLLESKLKEKELLLEELVSDKISKERWKQIHDLIMKDEIIQDE